MENQEQQQNQSQGPSVEEQAQKAQADLKQVADRAKAATTGFDFNKLFSGRVDNVNYFYAAIASLVAGFILGMIPVIGWLISIALCVVGIGMTIRRFHDINISGWATLIMLVPFVGFFAVIYLCWRKGDVGANAYGAAPEQGREFFKAVLNT